MPAHKDGGYICEDCDHHFGCDRGEMAVLPYALWHSIARDEEALCSYCIERRLGRPLTMADFPAAPVVVYKDQAPSNIREILCNVWFFRRSGIFMFPPLFMVNTSGISDSDLIKNIADCPAGSVIEVRNNTDVIDQIAFLPAGNDAVQAIEFAVTIDDHFDRLQFLQDWIEGAGDQWEQFKEFKNVRRKINEGPESANADQGHL